MLENIILYCCILNNYRCMHFWINAWNSTLGLIKFLLRIVMFDTAKMPKIYLIFIIINYLRTQKSKYTIV